MTRRGFLGVLAGAGLAGPARANLPESFWAREQRVPIEATGPTATAARQRAIAEGLRTAFRAMTRALSMPQEATDAQIRSAIVRLELERERSAPGRYSALLIVEFDEARVAEIVRR